jgi:NOL1/NOP2/fmu family ribosome biogenesis protein
VSANPDSAASVTAAQSEVEEGSQVQIKAEINEGWSFVRWTGDLSGTDSLESSVTVDSEIDATAQFERKEYELSVSTEGEGSVAEEVIETKDTYQHGTVVRLTAEPDSGWTFSSWAGDLSGEENPTRVTVESEMSITATFEKQRHSVETNSEGDGSLSRALVSGDQNSEGYVHGSEVELTAAPSDGWVFSNWKGNLSGTQATDTLVIDEDESVTAVFKELHSVSTSVEGEGSVSTDPSGGEQPEGAVVTFEADPDQGWEFDHWEGDISGMENPDSLEVQEPVAVTAVFEQEQYTVNVGKSGQGTIEYAPQKDNYVYGDTIALEASPKVDNSETSADAWELARWLGSPVTGYDPTHTVTSDAEITAEFKTYEEMIKIGFWSVGCMNECYDRLEVNLENGLRRAVYLDQVVLYDETDTSIKTVNLNVLLLPGEDSNDETDLTAFDLDDPPNDRDTIRQYTTEWVIEYTRPDGDEIEFEHYVQVSEFF